MTNVPPAEGFAASYPQPGAYPAPAGPTPGYPAPPPPTRRGLSREAIIGIVVAAVVVVAALAYFALSSGKGGALAAAKGDWNCTDISDDGDNTTFVLMIRDDVFVVRYHDDYYDEDGVFGGTWSLQNGHLSVAITDDTYGVDNVPGSLSGHLTGMIRRFDGGDVRDQASFNADLSGGSVQFNTDRDAITCTKQG